MEAFCISEGFFICKLSVALRNAMQCITVVRNLFGHYLKSPYLCFRNNKQK